MNKTISISGVSQETGLSERQLRSFQEKGYIDVPILITSGKLKYRRYTNDHIQGIKIFKKYLDQGFTLKMASHKAFEEIEKEVKDNVKATE